MKRPLVPVALCYAAGLLLAEAFQPPLLLLFFAAFVLLGVCLAWPRARTWVLWSLLAVTCAMTSIGLLEFVTHLDFFPKQKWQIKPLGTARINGVRSSSATTHPSGRY